MLIVAMAARGNTGAVVGSSIRMHVVMVVVAIAHVRIATVGTRAPPGMGIRVVEAECQKTRGEN